MALTPIDDVHVLQIQAGALGRKSGHKFEDEIATRVNSIPYPFAVARAEAGNLFVGCPGSHLLSFIGGHLGIERISKATAISTGALATSEDGVKWLSVNGVEIRKCKSDLVITIHDEAGNTRSFGISTKQCGNRTPTNAQLYFTTARSFSALLIRNGIPVSDAAVDAMRQFCGDTGFRPQDDEATLTGRVSDPRRFFWEEIREDGRLEWEGIFDSLQSEITRLLLQKAYLDDPFVPDFLLHKTKASKCWETTESAIYSIDELIGKSRNYGRFSVRNYSVRKGSHKDPPGVFHQAPRFGIVQMQRGGQAQHPTQLQFNLEAGYFYKI